MLKAFPGKLLVVAGPTASGKTDCGLALARAHHGEIISVDSRQVYRYLSIGTAKPQGQWIPRGNRESNYVVQGIPYHLVDILEPDQSFSAADFIRLAQEKILGIQNRGNVPILVGGTGLYFKALFTGLASLPPAQPEVRAELRARADREGRAALHQELAAIDPASARAIPANNIHRVIRALEVFQLTGKPISQWHREHREQPSAESIPHEITLLDPGKETLDKRIERRCEDMLGRGMITETEALLKRGFAKNCPALSGLGYPRVIAYLEKKISRDELLSELVRDTRQYAKRQRTWFRHQMPLSEPTPV